MNRLPKLAHHVFFWLKRPDAEKDRAKLLAGLRGLGDIETVRAIQIGVPASTTARDVVENSYSVSELLFFDSVEDQEAYQRDPLHLKFMEEHAHLWDKVVVFDTIES